MTSQQLTPVDTAYGEQPLSVAEVSETLEAVIISGDLGKLQPIDRVHYYERVCRSVGLNPLTKPFEYIVLNGKLTLYARADAAAQLRRLYSVSTRITDRTVIDGMLVVTAEARLPGGRVDESIGVVALQGLSGEAKANGMMKAETKAKRRVTLSICGLGFFDSSEIDEDSAELWHDDDRPQKRTPARVSDLYGAAPDPTQPQPRMTAAQAIAPPAAEPRISDAQRRMLHATAAKAPLGWQHDQVSAYAQARFGVRSTTDLTVTQANAYLADIQSGAIHADDANPPDSPDLPFEPPCPRCQNPETIDGNCGRCGFPDPDDTQPALMDVAPEREPAHAARGSH